MKKLPFNLATLEKSMSSLWIIVERKSPNILTGLGVSGFFVAIGTGIYSTKFALIAIEEEKKKKKVDNLSAIDIVKVAGKYYIPTGIMATASTLCVVSATSVNNRRNAALATAYAMSETAAKEYREKVLEEFGPRKEQKVYDAIAKDKVTGNPAISQEVILTHKGDTLCMDAATGIIFRSDIEKIKRAINTINTRLRNEMFISLNELYDELGLPAYGTVGDDIGWHIEYGEIEPIFSSILTDDDEPCLVINYSIEPRYNESRVW